MAVVIIRVKRGRAAMLAQLDAPAVEFNFVQPTFTAPWRGGKVGAAGTRARSAEHGWRRTNAKDGRRVWYHAHRNPWQSRRGRSRFAESRRLGEWGDCQGITLAAKGSTLKNAIEIRLLVSFGREL
jgi:hypothetical protein